MAKARKTNRVRLAWAKKFGKTSFKATPVYSPARFRPRQVDFSTPKGLVSFMKRLFAEKRVYYRLSKDPLGVNKMWMRPEVRAELTKKYEGFFFRGFEKFREPLEASLSTMDTNPMIKWLRSHNEPEPEKKAGAIFRELKKRCDLVNNAIVGTRMQYKYSLKKLGKGISDKQIYLYPDLVAMRNVADLGNITMLKTTQVGLIVDELTSWP